VFSHDETLEALPSISGAEKYLALVMRSGGRQRFLACCAMIGRIKFTQDYAELFQSEGIIGMMVERIEDSPSIVVAGLASIVRVYYSSEFAAEIRKIMRMWANDKSMKKSALKFLAAISNWKEAVKIMIDEKVIGLLSRVNGGGSDVSLSVKEIYANLQSVGLYLSCA
jgi:hypothetical protein